MSALHMISLPIDLRYFRRWSAGRGLAGDEGRALHHLLSETFGKGVLQPFRLMIAPGERSATLYAYAQAEETTLRRTAQETGAPDALTLVNLQRLAVKTMPETWRVGRRLAFDVRIRPVRRLLRPLEGWSRSEGSGTAKPFRKGAEVDAFLVATLRRFPRGRPAEEEPLIREDVYRAWLAERLEGAARLEAGRMVRCVRAEAERNGTSQGPDATFHGELTVADGVKFASALARGIGRHAAYGYGMLLLRPAGG